MPDPVLIDWLSLVLDSPKIEDIPVLRQFCHIAIKDFVEVVTKEGIIFTDENLLAILDGLENLYVTQSASNDRVNAYLFAIYSIMNFKPKAYFLGFFVELL